MTIKPLMSRKALRGIFVVYTAALLTATHWPGLAIKGPISRMDLIEHFLAFGFWTLLLGATGWISSSCCIRRQALLVGLIGIVFGWIDELTQPLFSRVFDLTDIAADMTGAIGGGVVLLIVWSKRNDGRCDITGDSVARSQPDARS